MVNHPVFVSVWGAAAFLFTALSANADLIARFDEGAPKDRFTFENVGDCTVENAILRLDLSHSQAGLIFDTTGSGAGVEVFQPLQFVSGAAALSDIPTVKDGDNVIELMVTAFSPDQAIAFTIDVDDTMGGREITVSDSEIRGAKVELLQERSSITASFGSQSEAVLKLPKC